jgi:hypothetical protein
LRYDRQFPDLKFLGRDGFFAALREGDFIEEPIGADSDDVARSFRDHVARCSDMMSPA